MILFRLYRNAFEQVDWPGNRTPTSWVQTRRHPVRPAAQSTLTRSARESNSIPFLQGRDATITPADPRSMPELFRFSNKILSMRSAVEIRATQFQF